MRDFFAGKYMNEPPAKQLETIGDLADRMARITESAPPDAFRDLPTSDQVDEVVYGIPQRVTAK